MIDSTGARTLVDPYEPPTRYDFLRYAEARRRELAQEILKVGGIYAEGASWAGWPILWVRPHRPVVPLRVMVGVLWVWWDRPPWRDGTRDRYPIARSDQPRQGALIVAGKVNEMDDASAALSGAAAG